MPVYLGKQAVLNSLPGKLSDRLPVVVGGCNQPGSSRSTKTGRSLYRCGPYFLTELAEAPSPLNPVPTPGPVPDPPREPVPPPVPVPDRTDVVELAFEIEESSTDSQNPGRFERAVRDAFDYLGFRAELLGGSGKTDVLLVARLGRSDSYKVTVDAKTTTSGRLTDGQVDWETLVDHRTRERADYSLPVGPDPSGGRLFARTDLSMMHSSGQLQRSTTRNAQPVSVSSPPMSSSSSLPEALPWEARLKSAYRLPGGDRGYLDTLRQICNIVDRLQPCPKDNLISSLESELAFESKNSQYIVSFLLRTDLLREEAGRCRVGCWTRRWLDSDDAGIAIALIHSRVRFIGEMLAELQTVPRSLSDLLSIANEKYGFRWKTVGSISNRRGWLQSAGFIEVNHDKNITITGAGRNFLTRLGEAPSPLDPVPPLEPVPDPLPGPVPPPVPVPDRTDIVELAFEIEESSTDSQNPGRFERAVRDAFDYLGFRAELLGGSGKTDVLLVARLGRSDSYKVTVDAKTTASGRLTDGQVDWETLVDHRTRERADYSLLVGPNPSGDRLFNRALRNKVTVLSAQQLAELCLRHADAPLGLDDYRLLFTTHGEADLTELDKRAERSEWLRGLAADICRTLAERGHIFGYHTARDLWMLRSQIAATHDQFEAVLKILASPLVGAVHGDPEKGYVLATDRKVAQLRLTLLGKELTSPEPAR